MNARRTVFGLGAAVTTFLLVGAATIELLGVGGSPAVGILGVFAGVVAGLLAGVLAGTYGDTLPRSTGPALTAYATLGLVFVAIPTLSYINVPGADAVFSLPAHVGISVGAAIVAALLTAFRGRRPRPAVA